jgi:hypothetical protein
MYVLFFYKKATTLHIPWRDSISRLIKTASGHGTTSPMRQRPVLTNNSVPDIEIVGAALATVAELANPDLPMYCKLPRLRKTFKNVSIYKRPSLLLNLATSISTRFLRTGLRAVSGCACMYVHIPTYVHGLKWVFLNYLCF